MARYFFGEQREERALERLLHQTRAAAEIIAECLELRVAQGNPTQIAKALVLAARMALLRGEAERAVRLWGAVEGPRATHQMPAPSDEDGDEERRTLALLRESLGAAADGEVANGRDLTQAEAICLARELLADVR